MTPVVVFEEPGSPQCSLPPQEFHSKESVRISRVLETTALASRQINPA